MASGLMNLLRRLVSPGKGEAADQGSGKAVEYKGCTIRPAPRKEGAHWLTAGVITKEAADGAVKEHPFVRADTHGSRDAADDFSIVKGKQIIDELGDRIFPDD